jgi:molecular chaperone GrpE
MSSMDSGRSDGHGKDRKVQVPVPAESSESQPAPAQVQPDWATTEESVEVWRDRALRLQAEMENYRKRQQRLAEERIVEERERLLRRFLQVADELERALAVQHTDVAILRRGVELTHLILMQLLEQENVQPLDAQGRTFDPEWHEAVGTASEHAPGLQPHTVVEVLRTGYRLGDRLLRPARVLIST